MTQLLAFFRQPCLKVSRCVSMCLNLSQYVSMCLNVSQCVSKKQRNHGFKYESDCVSIGIGIEIWIMEGFANECFVEFLSSTSQSNQNILFQNKFSFPLCLIWNKCKCPHRNYTPKRENLFAILISVCNFHISLQFSYQFAILTFWSILPTWMFAIFIWVCNFHMSLQFSYQFAILTSRL